MEHLESHEGDVPTLVLAGLVMAERVLSTLEARV